MGKFFDKRKSAYLFIVPFLAMFIVFWIWPIIQSFIWSFTEWDGIGERKFIKFDNYINLFRDASFLTSLRNTISAALVYIAILVVLAIILGFILSSSMLKGRAFFRTAFFIPVTVSLPVVALIFYIIYAPNNGILNNILSFAGIGSVQWLTNPKIALWSIVALRIWRALGYYTVFIIAGLQAIPKETIEAGHTDGANFWQVIRYIIIPQLKPVIVYIIVASSIWAFQLFEEPWILTQGGPANATATVAIHIYQNAFQFSRLGYASASSYILAMVIMIFAIVQFRIARD